MTRFTPRDTGFSLFMLDKRAPTVDPGPDEPDAKVPCWRTPQPSPHEHEDHEINLVVEGATRYRWNDTDGAERTAVVAAGQIFTVPGGVRHKAEVDSRAIVRGLWIHPRVVNSLPSPIPDPRLGTWTNPLPPRLVTDAALFATLQELFHQTQAEYVQTDPWTRTTIGSLAQLAAVGFLRLMAHRPQADSADATARVREVRAWMDRHYLENPPLRELAQRAGLGVSRFSEVFREVVGTSPKDHLMACRLRHAETLLLTTELPVSQIAWVCGFCHPANFTNLFRVRYGVSPGEHRKIRQGLPMDCQDQSLALTGSLS